MHFRYRVCDTDAVRLDGGSLLSNGCQPAVSPRRGRLSDSSLRLLLLLLPCLTFASLYNCGLQAAIILSVIELMLLRSPSVGQRRHLLLEILGQLVRVDRESDNGGPVRDLQLIHLVLLLKRSGVLLNEVLLLRHYDTGIRGVVGGRRKFELLHTLAMLGAEGTQKVKLVELFKTGFGGNDGSLASNDVLEHAKARMVGRLEGLRVAAVLVALPAYSCSGDHGLLFLHNVRAQNQVRSVGLIIWLLA